MFAVNCIGKTKIKEKDREWHIFLKNTTEMVILFFDNAFHWDYYLLWVGRKYKEKILIFMVDWHDSRFTMDTDSVPSLCSFFLSLFLLLFQSLPLCFFQKMGHIVALFSLFSSFQELKVEMFIIFFANDWIRIANSVFEASLHP